LRLPGGATRAATQAGPRPLVAQPAAS
jgi:hypothetical protein